MQREKVEVLGEILREADEARAADHREDAGQEQGLPRNRQGLDCASSTVVNKVEGRRFVTSPRAPQRAGTGCQRACGGVPAAGHGPRAHHRGLPRCGISAPHRVLLQERPRIASKVQVPRDRGDVQGNPRHGVVRGVRSQGARGRHRDRWDEAEGGGQGRPWGIRRDPELHEVPTQALAAHTHQQRHRTAQPLDPLQDEGGGHFL